MLELLQVLARVSLRPREPLVVLSGDGYCSVHPWVVGAHVLIGAIDREGQCVSGVLIHVPRVKPTCPRGKSASGCHRVWNRIVVGPSYLTAICDCYACRDIV